MWRSRGAFCILPDPPRVGLNDCAFRIGSVFSRAPHTRRQPTRQIK